MDRLIITFKDGSEVDCHGVVLEQGAGQLRANADGTFTEVKDSAWFEVFQGYLRREGDEEVALKRGVYMINDEGLWLHL